MMSRDTLQGTLERLVGPHQLTSQLGMVPRGQAHCGPPKALLNALKTCEVNWASVLRPCPWEICGGETHASPAGHRSQLQMRA